jgi:diphthamide biosynthesis protein 3
MMLYDDMEIEDVEWNEELQAYTYPCPCGHLFQITKDKLCLGEEIARCLSCSLYITINYNLEDFLEDFDQRLIHVYQASSSYWRRLRSRSCNAHHIAISQPKPVNQH